MQTILRNLTSRKSMSCPPSVDFFESSLKDTIVDVRDEDGKVIATRKSAEVIVRKIPPAESVRTDVAEDYSIQMMLETGVNNVSPSRPYFSSNLDDSTSVFELLNKDGLVERQSVTTEPPTEIKTPSIETKTE